MPARRPSIFRRTRGLTLVELLLATALLTVLMAGILAVVADFGASKKAIQALRQQPNTTTGTPPRPDDRTLDAWVRLLEDDLLHARQVDVKLDNQWEIIGYGALEVGNDPRAHRPVRIVYSLEEAAGQSCLIRRQTLLDVPSTMNVRRDLVCCGIQRFALSRPVAAPATAPSSAAGTPWRLSVWLPGQTAPAFERLIQLPGDGLGGGAS